ncbi:MAG: rhodanese-like domain-containing protein [Bacteroidetes bacterium]|nr:rhodanese-like domain-containing protein [Bacteroidota bacterium]
MKLITPLELKARLDAGEKIHLVDVRELHEHEEFNIGGILLPVGKIMSMETEPIEHLKNEEVVFYCRSGGRSAQACMFAETLGFGNVTNLTGGMLAWKEQCDS